MYIGLLSGSKGLKINSLTDFLLTQFHTNKSESACLLLHFWDMTTPLRIKIIIVYVAL